MRNDIDAAKVRAAREASGLSQDGAAKAIGVTKATVQNWENGRRRKVAGGDLMKMSEVYDAAPASLLADADAADAAQGWAETPEPE